MSSPTTSKHVKATRDDWIGAALDALASRPIDELRVLTLATDLSVSRSSFYWYFETPEQLTDELMALWERNTSSIVERAGRETPTIVSACLGVFECWADPALYHSGLDAAVRDWGRRNATVGVHVERADLVRLSSLRSMFAAHGFEPDEALVRARLLYHSQVGYHAVDTDESMSQRLHLLPLYLEAMTGTSPTDQELAAFVDVLGELAGNAS